MNILVQSNASCKTNGCPNLKPQIQPTKLTGQPYTLLN